MSIEGIEYFLQINRMLLVVTIFSSIDAQTHQMMSESTRLCVCCAGLCCVHRAPAVRCS